MIKNILQTAKSVRNDHTCIHDTNYGYNCTFTKNGSVAGWDVYDNVYLYGCWNKVLFGTSSATTCYIGRTNNIYPVSSEDFPIFRMMLKMTVPTNPYKNAPTVGRVQWKTSADDSWDLDKSEVYTIDSLDTWFMCELQLHGHQFWSNSITALRITLFEEGYEGISFAIRYIRLASDTNFVCLNTQCSYHTKYAHPCVGGSVFSSATASKGNDRYTTISGVSDSLLVNIDGYGDERLNLGNNIDISGNDMAKKINELLNRTDIGSYAYASVEHTEDAKLKITSGSLPSTTPYVPLDLNAELVLYIHAYSVSSTFKAALESIGWLFSNPVRYLYVIYGDILPFMEIVYGEALITSQGYYTPIGSLVDVLSEQGYFKDILAIKASDVFNTFNICGAIYYYNPISVSYAQTCDVHICAGAVSSSTQMITITDVSNDVLLFGPARVSGDPFYTSVSTKFLSFNHQANYQAINYVLASLGDGNIPDAFGYISYGYWDTAHTIDRVSEAWIFDTFGVLIGASDTFGEAVEITGGSAAETLGFYTNNIPTYDTITNVAPPSGFDFASAKRLRAFELAKLINNKTTSLGYLHEPDQPTVDAGRYDYFEALASNTYSVSSSDDYCTKLEGAGKIIIDFTHPISDCGRLTNIKIGGAPSVGMLGEIIIFRPFKDGTLQAVNSFPMIEEHSDYVYSSDVTTSYLSFNAFVSKGDLIGFKNVDLLCLFSSKTRTPNAILYEVASTVDVFLPFDPGTPISQGVIGPSYYAYSDRYQDSLKLLIDVGKRVNLNGFHVYGQEFGDYFEYNLAACLDVEWHCSLFNDNHIHKVCHTNGYCHYDTHENRAYGLDSLNNCNVTVDGGQEGTSWDGVEGLATYGEHSYFYVNGDAEWLNSVTGKSEYSYPYTGYQPTSYENDPVALYLTIPQGKSVDLFKSTVYFKEAPNFRKMGVSYYLGPDSLEASADVVGYRYVTGITSVALDGVVYHTENYKESDDWTIGKFVTTNPLPDSRLTYIEGSPINGDLYNLAGNLRWNIFEHEFDPVDAYGFMIYSDWHKSTKIVEIELYSRFSIKPTLVDNVTVQSSVYGDVWDTLSFKPAEDGTSLISAFVASTPRYFKISIEPQDICEIYEVSVSLDDSGKSSIKCDDSVVPATAKNGSLSSVSRIDIENIYDIPLHLYVNIPKDLISSMNLLAWNRLSSEETSFYGEVGPGALVYKNNDYPLVSYNNQIAINCPSYYLKNLIDNKLAYVYEYDAVWRHFGELVTNQSVDYGNIPSGFVATHSFDVVASKYWKVLFGDCVSRPIKAYKMYTGSVEVVPKNVYMQVESTKYSRHRIPVLLDTDGFISNTEVFSYAFSNLSYLATWSPIIDSGAYFLSNDSRGFYPVNLPPGTGGRLTTVLPYSSNSFEFVVDFTFLPHSYLINYSLSVMLQDAEGNDLLTVLFISDDSAVEMSLQFFEPDKEYNPIDYPYDYGDSIRINRSHLVDISGELRLLIKKTTRSIDYVTLTDRDESTVYASIVPNRTYFSSRVSNISFSIANTTDYYLPSGIPTPRLVYSNVKSIVIEHSSNYGYEFNTGLRAVDLYTDYGQLIQLTNNVNCTCYHSSTYSGYFSAAGAFNTSLSKIGAASVGSYLSYYTPGVEGRLICDLHDSITFSELIITNYHNVGSDTDHGIKDVKIYVVYEHYSDTTYESPIPNSVLIYDGELQRHVSENVADSKLLTTSGTGEFVSDYENNNDLRIGVTALTLKALPIISRFESIVFEFDKVTPLNSIDIITEGAAMEHSVVMLSDKLADNYSIWARCSSKFRMTEESHSAFVSSGYTVGRSSSNNLKTLYPYYVMDRGVTELNSAEYEYSASTGQRPLWVAYDFGLGNECEIHVLSVRCYKSIYTYLYDVPGQPLPDLPTTIHVYGSNDSEIDWENKPKDLLATVSGCYNGQLLYIELDTTIPYRYYCLYAPNIEQDLEEYTLAFKYLTMYSHLYEAKRNYSVYVIDRSSTSHTLNYNITALYDELGYYTYSVGGQPHYLIDLKELQCISAFKFKEAIYFTGFASFASLEYSLDSTNGLDGTWHPIISFKMATEYEDSSGELLYQLLTFKPVFATWLRIFVAHNRKYNITSRFDMIMPILGQMPSALTITNSTYDNYFVVDLGDVYSLDFVRNYGDSSSLLNLFDVVIKTGKELFDTEVTASEQFESSQIESFDTSGTHYWTAPEEDCKLDILIVAGGGAGGDGPYVGGGGGGGGVIYLEDVPFVLGETYTFVVGKGGVGTDLPGPGENGADSSAFGHLAVGGGGGGGGDTLDTLIGRAGGSGGGGAGGEGALNGTSYLYAGGESIEFQGNAGGIGKGAHTNYIYWRAGAGGGGAGAVGTNTVQAGGGDGGAGMLSDISGESFYYGAGGGGSSLDLYDTIFGGSYVGGIGSNEANNATDGWAGTGAGGGGSSSTATGPAGSGGCGVIIVRCSKTQTVSVTSIDKPSTALATTMASVLWEDYSMGSKIDARWVRIPLQCGTGLSYFLQYLGIYPDISKAYRKSGGYNCEWLPIGVGLTDYSYAINVAPQASITLDNNWFGNYSPSKCLQGDSSLVGYSNCWGFKKTDSNDYPTLELRLNSQQYVRTFKVTHSPDDMDVEAFTNKSYRISGKLEELDDYSVLFVITNNTETYREHALDSGLLLQYIKLEILSYDSNDTYYYYDAATESSIRIETGFLREFEVWTDTGYVTLNSEEHPVVCIDLIEAQTITSHELELLKEDPEQSIAWDNSDSFFGYSDEVTDKPNKVSFTSSDTTSVLYTNQTSYIDYTELATSFNFDNDIYLSEGSYSLNWESYNATYPEGVSLVLIGPSTIWCVQNNVASGWYAQLNYFGIDSAGYYTLNTIREVGADLGQWGVRNISIIKTVSNTKWVAVKRNTAINQAWDDKTYGVSYINRIKVYSETSYLPTEYPWFWSSTISTFSREHSNVKEGRYALRVDYPTASGVDRVDFLEGDHFGWDMDWSIKDSLSFWWFISDLDNLYIDEGGFGFGSFVGGDNAAFTNEYGKLQHIEAKQAYYLWDFKYLNLKTGWNYIKLQFDKNTYTAPLQVNNLDLLDVSLNFRANYFTSFGFVYKGVGNPFYMLFDGMKIERNFYNDIVKETPGLCLTWKEYAEIPLAGATLHRGTIEFWVKTYTSSFGRDCFGDTASRVLFTLTNNHNEVLCLTLKSAGWFELGIGGARYNFNIISLDPAEYDLDEFSFNIDDTFHIAVVWSSSGTDMDNSDTLRLYINNTLLISSQVSWEVSDTKSSILRFGGGSTILANNNDEEGAAIFSNVKVYDYCKNKFNLETHVPEDIVVLQNNAPVQISKDGNIFYDYMSEVLPLKYEEVPPGEKVSLYTRINKTNKIRSSDSGAVEIDWEVIV